MYVRYFKFIVCMLIHIISYTTNPFWNFWNFKLLFFNIEKKTSYICVAEVTKISHSNYMYSYYTRANGRDPTQL
jgi:hypothetical protein